MIEDTGLEKKRHSVVDRLSGGNSYLFIYIYMRRPDVGDPKK